MSKVFPIVIAVFCITILGPDLRADESKNGIFCLLGYSHKYQDIIVQEPFNNIYRTNFEIPAGFFVERAFFNSKRDDLIIIFNNQNIGGTVVYRGNINDKFENFEKIDTFSGYFYEYIWSNKKSILIVANDKFITIYDIVNSWEKSIIDIKNYKNPKVLGFIGDQVVIKIGDEYFLLDWNTQQLRSHLVNQSELNSVQFIEDDVYYVEKNYSSLKTEYVIVGYDDTDIITRRKFLYEVSPVIESEAGEYFYAKTNNYILGFIYRQNFALFRVNHDRTAKVEKFFRCQFDSQVTYSIFDFSSLSKLEPVN